MSIIIVQHLCLLIRNTLPLLQALSLRSRAHSNGVLLVINHTSEIS